ncbi:MAG: thioredoxin-dependent thiol peroxidase [Nitrospirae bacterium]|nr:thioredoxin-dependent thiol peroxidase [Nitrospirota bacterium]MBI3605259.1 thioredoxin-dependent thiol peroxidase [Nitrospirota bacterium]
MANELAVGDKAPDFNLPSSTGEKISLKSLKGKTVILFFYPRDNTPGCTKEACGFRDALPRFKKISVAVLGVSNDSLESHKKFIDQFGLTFPLLSDEDHAVSEKYGVYKEKNLYGKIYWGIERSTFVIDPEGKLKGIFRKVKVDNHIEEVLDSLK